MSNAFSDILVQRLVSARYVTVFTGAGVSAESGIATFRDLDGMWSRFKPEELANVNAFLSNPSLVQSWYQQRKRIVTEAEPNAGHRAIAAFERHFLERGHGFALVTQNVDNLHQRAGSKNVIELHGNLARNYCFDCNRDASEEEMHTKTDEDSVQCVECGGLIRPDVVWFGEQLPAQAIEGAVSAARRSSVCLSVGTSAVVYPAAQIPLLASEEGAYVAEINVAPSAIASMIDETVQGKAGDVLPALFDAYKEALSSSDESYTLN